MPYFNFHYCSYGKSTWTVLSVSNIKIGKTLLVWSRHHMYHVEIITFLLPGRRFFGWKLKRFVVVVLVCVRCCWSYRYIPVYIMLMNPSIIPVYDIAVDEASHLIFVSLCISQLAGLLLLDIGVVWNIWSLLLVLDPLVTDNQIIKQWQRQQ